MITASLMLLVEVWEIESQSEMPEDITSSDIYIITESVSVSKCFLDDSIQFVINLSGGHGDCLLEDVESGVDKKKAA